MEKINRQFWGKLIRQSTPNTRLQFVTWGGGAYTPFVTLY